ncbi:MAG: endonuclease [Eggerthellaceae bacterium]|nr:endonuclease [Eggerthellaceae bacterium]
MPRALKRTLQFLGIIIAVVLVVVIGYIAYLELTYYRIADATPVEVENNPTTTLAPQTTSKVATYNSGFGAYTPDYTFFMDEGVKNDGTATVGEHSTAVSKESVEACTAGAIDTLLGLDVDFALLQEVDTNSTRSYQVNQKAAVENAYPDYSSAFAVNFHSGYLAYPVSDPHGTVNAGLLVVGDAHVDEAVRYSYPIDEAFPTKFFDLDRCFLIERLPVSNGKELILINSHMSAYDEGGLIRAQQFALLTGIMEKEASEGNYVIVGGDWNHALCGSAELYPSQAKVPPWVATFDDRLLPEGFSVVAAENLAEVPTCRNNDIPYEKGVTYTTTVDGFIVSSNVEATAQNIDTGFAYSDHNPVLLTFRLLPQTAEGN